MLRRTVLKCGLVGLVGAGSLEAGPGSSAEGLTASRRLWVHRVQTQEEGHLVYYRDHVLVTAGYDVACYLLRDVEAGQLTRMDPRLLHLLCGMQTWMRTCGIQQPVRILSGYRAAQTPAASEEAASQAQHHAGRAVDVAVEGMPSAVLAKLAAAYHAGGVGLYPTYVHVDTGPVRTWTG